VTTAGPPFLRKQHGSEPPFCGDRDRDLVEMNHRIANSLQLAANYLKLQAKELADDSRARLALGATAARLSAIGDLHRQIGTSSDTSGIDLARYLVELCSKITDSTGVDVSFVGQPVDVSVPMAQGIAQIVTELAINVGKHCSTGQGNGLLRVDCRCDRGNVLHLILSDEGPGLPADSSPGASGGFGLAIVASAVQQLEGRLDVTSNGGTVFELTVPLH